VPYLSEEILHLFETNPDMTFTAHQIQWHVAGRGINCTKNSVRIFLNMAEKEGKLVCNNGKFSLSRHQESTSPTLEEIYPVVRRYFSEHPSGVSLQLLREFVEYRLSLPESSFEESGKIIDEIIVEMILRGYARYKSDGSGQLEKVSDWPKELNKESPSIKKESPSKLSGHIIRVAGNLHTGEITESQSK
jgi:hypothetical protein